MDPEHLRRFAERDFAAVEREKRRYWSDLYVRDPERAIRIAHELWSHARSVDPAFPTDASRRADFQSHVRLSRLLREASDELAVRNRSE